MVEGHETFLHAPIDEAVIEFRVLRTDAPIDVLDAFMAEIQGDYPERRARVGFQASLTIPAVGRPDAAAPAWELDRRPDGWLLRNPDRPFAVQVRLNAVSVSRLKPYTTWDDLVQEARTVWAAYVRATLPAEVVRLGARYLNRFSVPMVAGSPIDDWLLSYPARGRLVPQSLIEFNLRTVIAREDSRAFAVLTQTLEQADATSQRAILLDIDAFAPVAMSPTDEAMWTMLGELRDLKNRVFFGSITDKTRELFR